jgi:hypothetical protein
MNLDVSQTSIIMQKPYITPRVDILLLSYYKT